MTTKIEEPSLRILIMSLLEAQDEFHNDPEENKLKLRRDRKIENLLDYVIERDYLDENNT